MHWSPVVGNLLQSATKTVFTEEDEFLMWTKWLFITVFYWSFIESLLVEWTPAVRLQGYNRQQTSGAFPKLDPPHSHSITECHSVCTLAAEWSTLHEGAEHQQALGRSGHLHCSWPILLFSPAVPLVGFIGSEAPEQRSACAAFYHELYSTFYCCTIVEVCTQSFSHVFLCCS